MAICDECNQKFHHRQEKQRFCSKLCSRRWHHKEKLRKRREREGPRHCEECHTDISDRVHHATHCKACAAEITRKRNNTSHKRDEFSEAEQIAKLRKDFGLKPPPSGNRPCRECGQVFFSEDKTKITTCPKCTAKFRVLAYDRGLGALATG